MVAARVRPQHLTLETFLEQRSLSLNSALRLPLLSGKESGPFAQRAVGWRIPGNMDRASHASFPLQPQFWTF